MKTEYRIVVEDSVHGFSVRINELASAGFIVAGSHQVAKDHISVIMKREKPQEQARSWIHVPPQWIDPKVNAPDFDKRVLVKAMSGKIVISKLVKEGSGRVWHDDDGARFQFSSVIEWMDLPK